MSDLDFAELDKAVNNLVNKNKPNESSPPPQKNEPDSGSHDLPNNSSAREPKEQISQQPQGRFMDVFHHSSDMTGKENAPFEKFVPTPPAPRKVVSPLSSGVANDVVLPEKRKMPTPASPPPPQPETQVAPQSDWPDPIDAVKTNKEDSSPSANQDLAAKIAPTSLFLPDTKVEKRPLGGVNSDTTSETEEDDKKKEFPAQSADLPTDSLNENKVAPTDLPPELEADLVAIEEGGGEDKREVFKEFDDEQQATSKKPDIDFLDDDDNDDNKDSVPFIQPQDDAPETAEQVPEKPKHDLSGLLASGSIPQQYKTAATTSESAEETHPIFFDADQYSKAPSPGTEAHKPRKTTLFQWIFIVVGLLLLGATLGAAVFVFVSGQ